MFSALSVNELMIGKGLEDFYKEASYARRVVSDAGPWVEWSFMWSRGTNSYGFVFLVFLGALYAKLLYMELCPDLHLRDGGTIVLQIFRFVEGPPTEHFRGSSMFLILDRCHVDKKFKFYNRNALTIPR